MINKQNNLLEIWIVLQKLIKHMNIRFKNYNLKQIQFVNQKIKRMMHISHKSLFINKKLMHQNNKQRNKKKCNKIILIKFNNFNYKYKNNKKNLDQHL